MPTYNEIRSDLKTGDIVLFYGEGFISRFISIGSSIVKRRFKQSPSHETTVVRNKHEVMIFESTKLNKDKNYITGKREEGPQMNLLSQRIANYKGRVTVRHVINKHVTPEMRGILSRYRKEVAGKPYETSNWEVMRSVLGRFRLPWTEKADPASLFCSEMATELRKRWGWLPDWIISNQRAPVDSADGGWLEDYIHLTPEIEIIKEVA